MASEEIQFLKEQVQRLNNELAKYQEGGRRLTEEDLLQGDDVPAPWLTDKGLLSPLIVEYDGQVKDLQQMVEAYEDELKILRPQVKRLVQENDRLSTELRETVSSQVPHLDPQDTEPLQNDEQLLHNLQMQVDLAVQEKENAIERWHEAEQEIDRLQHQLQEEKNSHQWGVIEQQAHQMQTEYFETVQMMNREVEQLQQDLRQTRQELETANLQLKDVRKTNKELEQSLSWKDQEMSEVIFKEGISDSKIGELKRIMDDLRSRASSCEHEVEEHKRDKSALEARLSELQKRSTDVANREMEAVNQMREAVQMVETASLEKEEAEVTLQKKEEELDHLRDVINKLINEAGARTRQEVDTVRTQCNERINKLTEEVHALEMDNSEKQDTLEKAMREKRAAEAELERMYKDGMSHMTKEAESFETMNKRAIAAERARDDALMELETVHQKTKREDLNTQQLKQQVESQLNNNRDRMSQLQQEFENINDDRLRLLDEVDELKKRLQSANQEKEAAQRKYTKEITIFEQENTMKVREMEVKLQSTEDVNRHSMSELRKLLAGQQRMCAKWKEECTSISQKYEMKLKDVRDEMGQLKRRNQEVTKVLKDSQEKTVQAEKMIHEYTRGIHRMEQRMRESENRASDASKQLSRHILREKQMENERRSLTQELKRSTMEASLKTSRNHQDDLLISDLAGSHASLRGSQHKKGEIDDFLQER